MKNAIALISLVAIHIATQAQTSESPEKDINAYLVDITGGAVSASALINDTKTAITQIQTSQDLVLAIQPLTSNSGQKSAYGFSITPAKTTIFPMAGSTYVANPLARLLGNLTLSYAQSNSDITSISYQKSAYSVDTVYYLRLDDDPVYAGSKAFQSCAQDKTQNAKDIDDLNKKRRAGEISDGDFLKQLTDLTVKRDALLTPCIDKALSALSTARWNSSRISLSYGEGKIRPAAGGSSSSLGRSWNLNAQIYASEKSALAISLRNTQRALDLTSIGKVSPIYNSSSLAAARYTYGDQTDTSLRGILEVSNSKSAAGDLFKEVFIYALGIDKKVLNGTWLDFRVGRNRSLADGKEQTSALLGISFSPTLFAYKK